MTWGYVMFVKAIAALISKERDDKLVTNGKLSL